MRSRFAAAPLLIALILMLTLACSGDDSPAAPDTDRAQQELLERIDQQSNEVRDLREEVEQLRRSDETEQPSAQATELPPTQATETIQPSSPTLPPPPEVSNTENICDRSPGAQQALLRNLKISSCKAVTTEEIYRITGNIKPAFSTSPRAGDFLGLVNVTHLEIHISTGVDPAEIPANAFYGMERLKSLSIYVRAETTFRDGAFQGLPSLTALTIDADAPTIMETGSLSGMPSLENMDIKMKPPGQVMAGALRDLPNLETLTMNWHAFREEDETKKNHLGELEQLPSLKYLTLKATLDYTDIGDLPSVGPTHFKDLPILEYLQIDGRGNNPIQLNQTSFANSPNLKEIEIRASGNQETSGLKNTFKSLHQLEELTISLSEHGETRTVEVDLSPNSPLMKDILNGDKKPKGVPSDPAGSGLTGHNPNTLEKPATLPGVRYRPRPARQSAHRRWMFGKPWRGRRESISPSLRRKTESSGTGPVMTRKPQGSKGCREARAEVRVSRRR